MINTLGAHRSGPDPAKRRMLIAGLTAPAASWGTGLWVGLAKAADVPSSLGSNAAGLVPGAEALTAWIHIEPGSKAVTLVVSQAEIGQGISTTLPAVLADELGADWANVKLQDAPWHPAFKHPKYQWMFTGNSESVQGFYPHLRKMAAAARQMLILAASQVWRVDPAECDTFASHVHHKASGRQLHFGQLASAASQLPVPEDPALRPDADLRLVGRPVPRVDLPGKVNGTAEFGIDASVPDMWVAAVRTVPELGARLVETRASTAKGMPGVRAIVALPQGVAVVADRYWQARRALATIELKAELTASTHAADSASIEAGYLQVLKRGPFVMAVNEGQAPGAPAGTHAATYLNPAAAHATMEPMNCIADVTAERCTVWAPTQGQDLAAVALQHALGLPADRINVYRSKAIGGGFGRRLLPDFVVQAALISRQLGRPVKVIWDREEDMRRDFYRPPSALTLHADLDARGLPTRLDVRLVSPTILAPVFPPIQKTLDETGIDPSAIEGLERMPYQFKARSVRFHLARTGLPTSVMRTTGFGPNLFAVEGFLDELSTRARTDPFAMRRRLLAHHAGALTLLDRLESSSGWRRPLPRGMGRGLAFAEAFGSLIGMVVEVQMQGRAIKVRRVTTVVDCGFTLDPVIARAGIEGGIVFGLAYCKTEVTFQKGRLQQDNLSTYALPTLAETPAMHVEFLRSERELGGIGEIGPVALPPALANAIFAASGRRIRSMPLSRHGLQLA